MTWDALKASELPGPAYADRNEPRGWRGLEANPAASGGQRLLPVLRAPLHLSVLNGPFLGWEALRALAAGCLF